MDWFCKTFDKLTKDELYALLHLRAEVFVVEQDCPYQDVDNKDKNAIHVFAEKNAEIVAYARILKPGDYFQETCIGRIVTKQTLRGTGLGRELVKKSIEYIEAHFKTNTIHISAQTHLKRYYESFGFIQDGAEYLEDNIPHIGMTRSK